MLSLAIILQNNQAEQTRSGELPVSWEAAHEVQHVYSGDEDETGFGCQKLYKGKGQRQAGGGGRAGKEAAPLKLPRGNRRTAGQLHEC